MQKHHFEFTVTPFIDWRQSQTVYVRAASAGEAQRFMDRLTDANDENKPYADYRYLCYVPENCLWDGCDILDVDDEIQYVLEIHEYTDEKIPFMKWYRCRMNGRIVAIIGANIIVEDRWHIMAYDEFGSYGKINFDFTGYAHTLEQAKDKVDEFCKYLHSKEVA